MPGGVRERQQRRSPIICMSVEDLGDVVDHVGIGCCLDQVGLFDQRVVWPGGGELRNALLDGAGVVAGDDALADGGFGVQQTRSAVVAREADGFALGVDDLRGGREVELAGVAEPDAVPAAESLMSGQVNGDVLGVALAGDAASACVAGPHWRPAGMGPVKVAERGEGVKQGGCLQAGEGSEVLEVCGLCSGGAGELVVADGAPGEPGRQVCQEEVDRNVVGRGQTTQVGSDRLSGQRCDTDRQGLGRLVLSRPDRRERRRAPGFCSQTAQPRGMPVLRSSRVNAE